MRSEKQTPRSARDDKSVITRSMAVCAMTLIAVFSLEAQAPEPARLPGEPHHHLKIDNEYVRAYYVEVAPHEATQLHQHDHDYIFVTLGATDVINAVLGKPEGRLVLKDGDVHFSRGNFAHVARNLSDAAFRNVTIELLKPQGEAKNLCTQIVPEAASGGCDKRFVTTRKGQGFSLEPQMETAEVNLDLIRLGPKMKRATMAWQADSLVVALNESEVQIEVKGKLKKTLHGGEVAWMEAGTRGLISNPSKKPSDYLQLSFKDSGGSAKP